MTADVVGFRPTTALGGKNYSYGNGYGNGNGNNNNNDILERFFSGWESIFCGGPKSKEALAGERLPDPDVLDYVFDSVESFTCRDASSLTSPPPSSSESYHGNRVKGGVNYNYNSFGIGHEELRRENSLVETGPNGRPKILLSSSKKNKIAQQEQQHQHQQERDLLDYCFENVESYICNNNDNDNDNDNDTNTNTFGGTTNPSHYSSSFKSSNNYYNNNINRRPHSARPIPSEIVTPNPIDTEKKRKRRRNRRRGDRRSQRKQNYYPDEEDNILLYYRPMKRDE